MSGAKTVVGTKLLATVLLKSLRNMAPIYLNRILKPASSIHSYNPRNSKYHLFVPTAHSVEMGKRTVFNIVGLFCGTQLATER